MGVDNIGVDLDEMGSRRSGHKQLTLPHLPLHKSPSQHFKTGQTDRQTDRQLTTS